MEINIGVIARADAETLLRAGIHNEARYKQAIKLHRQGYYDADYLGAELMDGLADAMDKYEADEEHAAHVESEAWTGDDDHDD